MNRPDPRRPHASPSPADALRIGLVVCGFATAYSLVALLRHWRFETSIDLAIFDQAVWHLSRFERPASSILGLSSILGDHFYPIIGLFAPLYWISPRPEMMLVAQAALFAGSIVPVFLFLRDRLPASAALCLAISYGLFWGLQRAIAADVHEMAFAPAIIASVIFAMDRKKWWLFWLSSLALVFVKEDLIPVLTFAGLLLIGRGERRRGAVLVVLSVAVFLIVVLFAIPAFNDAQGYKYGGFYSEVLERPWRIPAILVTPPTKIETAFMWLAPFCFLSLRSPLIVLLIPLVLERFLSAGPMHWGTSFHYSAPLAPIIAMSAGDGLARMRRQTNAVGDGARRFLPYVLGAILLMTSLLPGHLPLWMLLSPAYYTRTALQRTGDQALERVPRDASVVAQAAVLPHLSQREHVYLLDGNQAAADLVVAGADLSLWPAQTPEELAAMLAAYREKGYGAVFEENGWTVLARNAPAILR